eukprot:TRINITY_DN868_c0_g1::TRINITY_DN868_c0_g1_i1::g.25418::m.25418 TRINITY_DN868_c0_g1::TRINITY_DN868_c0_g1_i1::g.25418  ORF type:complete len:258 (+),score=9.85,RmuC/PF02646.11/0.069,RmuC/PF02646.11/1.3e+03,DUF4164/PF13747.1/0.16,DUF4164/PF13747.1/1.2e+03,Syntaxin-6_N/PF09177.6/0.3,Syntaxin-6_N/PF09177.6/1.8e+03 TRINITY_DN868_c0_g1_i1:435-1208(+)
MKSGRTKRVSAITTALTAIEAKIEDLEKDTSKIGQELSYANRNLHRIEETRREQIVNGARRALARVDKLLHSKNEALTPHQLDGAKHLLDSAQTESGADAPPTHDYDSDQNAHGHLSHIDERSELLDGTTLTHSVDVDDRSDTSSSSLRDDADDGQISSSPSSPERCTSPTQLSSLQNSTNSTSDLQIHRTRHSSPERSPRKGVHHPSGKPQGRKQKIDPLNWRLNEAMKLLGKACETAQKMQNISSKTKKNKESRH